MPKCLALWGGACPLASRISPWVQIPPFAGRGLQPENEITCPKLLVVADASGPSPHPGFSAHQVLTVPLLPQYYPAPSIDSRNWNAFSFKQVVYGLAWDLHPRPKTRTWRKWIIGLLALRKMTLSCRGLGGLWLRRRNNLAKRRAG